MRLGLVIDDFEVDAEPLAHRGGEGRPVGGRAAGLGRDGAGPGHPARDHLVAAHPKRLESARNSGLAQAPGQRQPLAQANDARERVDHSEAIGRRSRDQKPTIVRAQIQGRISPGPAIAHGGRRALGTQKRRVNPLIRTQRGNFAQTNPRNQSPATPRTKTFVHGDRPMYQAWRRMQRAGSSGLGGPPPTRPPRLTAGRMDGEPCPRLSARSPRPFPRSVRAPPRKGRRTE